MLKEITKGEVPLTRNTAYNVAEDETHAAFVTRVVLCLHDLNYKMRSAPPFMIVEYGQYADVTVHPAGLPETAFKLVIEHNAYIVGAQCEDIGSTPYYRYMDIQVLDPQEVLNIGYNYQQ
jgi:hypothetical protein